MGSRQVITVQPTCDACGHDIPIESKSGGNLGLTLDVSWIVGISPDGPDFTLVKNGIYHKKCLRAIVLEKLGLGTEIKKK